MYSNYLTASFTGRNRTSVHLKVTLNKPTVTVDLYHNVKHISRKTDWACWQRFDELVNLLVNFKNCVKRIFKIFESVPEEPWQPSTILSAPISLVMCLILYIPSSSTFQALGLFSYSCEYMKHTSDVLRGHGYQRCFETHSPFFRRGKTGWVHSIIICDIIILIMKSNKAKATNTCKDA